MIGNDVVDLGDPDTAAGAQHPRFDARVFAPAEREALAAAAAPHRLRWVFWAAKEAAYKAARKRDPRTVFSPSRFVVALEGDEGVVRAEAGAFAVAIHSAATHVHAIACAEPGADPPRSGEVRCGAAPIGEVAGREHPELPSRRARAAAIADIAAALGAEPGALAIVTRDRIPRLEWRGRPAPVDLSLSHHGRFVAWAFRLAPGGIAA